jgi:hypothetical protein
MNRGAAYGDELAARINDDEHPDVRQSSAGQGSREVNRTQDVNAAVIHTSHPPSDYVNVPLNDVFQAGIANLYSDE